MQNIYSAQLKLDLSLVFRRNNLQEHGVAPETIVIKGEKRLKGAFELPFMRQTQCRHSLKIFFLLVTGQTSPRN